MCVWRSLFYRPVWKPSALWIKISHLSLKHAEYNQSDYIMSIKWDAGENIMGKDPISISIYMYCIFAACLLELPLCCVMCEVWTTPLYICPLIHLDLNAAHTAHCSTAFGDVLSICSVSVIMSKWGRYSTAAKCSHFTFFTFTIIRHID